LTVDVPDVARVAAMTEAEKRKLLEELWTKTPPVSAPPVRPTTGIKSKEPAQPRAQPGTALKSLLVDLGIGEDLVGAMCGGGCEAYEARMNGWGIAGCRERFYEIAGRLHDQAIKHKARFRDDPILWAKLAKRAAGMGLILNPASPYAGLVDESIRRAEEDVKG
jgi:hypothetical protein